MRNKPENKRLSLRDYLSESGAQYVLSVIDEMRTGPDMSDTAAKKLAAKELQISMATLYRTIQGASKAEAGGKVYLMRHACGSFKIGFTSGAPRFREKTLQAEDPQIELVQWWFGTPSDERAMHALFAAKRQRGEWFTLAPEDIETIQRYMRARES